VAQKLAITEALSAVEKERDALNNKLEKAKQDNQTASQLAKAKRTQEVNETAAKKDAEIQALKAKLDGNEIAKKTRRYRGRECG